MVKKWSRLPLCAVMAAFVLAAFGACSDGDSGGSSGGQFEFGPFTTARYETVGDGEPGWDMCFAATVPVRSTAESEGLEAVLAERIGEVTVRFFHIIVADGTLKSAFEDEDVVVNYSYDSDKREVYVQVLKAYLGQENNEPYGDAVYGGKEEYVKWCLHNGDFWTRTGQEDKLEELADKIFSVVHTYGYEKDETTGVITLTRKTEMTCIWDNIHKPSEHITLTPSRE